MITELDERIANSEAKAYGTTHATKIIKSAKINRAKVTKYVGPHGVSKRGYTCSVSYQRKHWQTYKYVKMVCEVTIPDREAKYNCDNH